LDPDPHTSVRCSTRKFRLNHQKIDRICATVLGSLGLNNTNVAIEFVGPRRIQKLNADFRSINSPTDVLSFPAREWRKPLCISKRPVAPTDKALTEAHLGDIAICPVIAGENARDIGQGLDRETGFLLIHGLLHLVGHDHMKLNEERLMLSQQRKLMRLLTPIGRAPLWKNCITRKRN
jgi:probable rRNA maturation factor